MLLTIDMGNTDITLGFFEGDDFIMAVHALTDRNRHTDEYALLFKDLINNNKNLQAPVTGAILASVVPSLTNIVARAVKRAFNIEPMIVGYPLKTGLDIKIDNPSELGADLVCDAVGVKELYGAPAIIADLGTATKLLVINENGSFAGAIFFPGIKISMKALVGSAAQLLETGLQKPAKIVGKNTVDAMNSGAINGTIAMINGLIKMIEDEIGYPTKHILTGGYSYLVRDHIGSDWIYQPRLVLYGLKAIYKRNTEDKHHA